ncbi:MAG: hypothetical protein HQL54_14320 [Magnetococcales bacterium]|nr:hypothetical protein [Magnetococcales bacterium]
MNMLLNWLFKGIGPYIVGISIGLVFAVIIIRWAPIPKAVVETTQPKHETTAQNSVTDHLAVNEATDSDSAQTPPNSETETTFSLDKLSGCPTQPPIAINVEAAPVDTAPTPVQTLVNKTQSSIQDYAKTVQPPAPKKRAEPVFQHGREHNRMANQGWPWRPQNRPGATQPENPQVEQPQVEQPQVEKRTTATPTKKASTDTTDCGPQPTQTGPAMHRHLTCVWQNRCIARHETIRAQLERRREACSGGNVQESLCQKHYQMLMQQYGSERCKTGGGSPYQGYR